VAVRRLLGSAGLTSPRSETPRYAAANSQIGVATFGVLTRPWEISASVGLQTTTLQKLLSCARRAFWSVGAGRSRTSSSSGGARRAVTAGAQWPPYDVTIAPIAETLLFGVFQDVEGQTSRRNGGWPRVRTTSILACHRRAQQALDIS
jgi:hypothetical protein